MNSQKSHLRHFFEVQKIGARDYLVLKSEAETSTMIITVAQENGLLYNTLRLLNGIDIKLEGAEISEDIRRILAPSNMIRSLFPRIYRMKREDDLIGIYPRWIKEL